MSSCIFFVARWTKNDKMFIFLLSLFILFISLLLHNTSKRTCGKETWISEGIYTVGQNGLLLKVTLINCDKTSFTITDRRTIHFNKRLAMSTGQASEISVGLASISPVPRVITFTIYSTPFPSYGHVIT